LQCQSSFENLSQSSRYNWLFLPGGPGLGSEALAGLTGLLKDKIPGTIWHCDFPNDGSNRLVDRPISNWRAALVQAVGALDDVILVAHSTPGMFVQAIPELEKILSGLVLIGSAPDASWQIQFEKYCEKNVDPVITEAEKDYVNNPGDESLRKLLIAAAKHCFVTDKSLQQGRQLFMNIPVNYSANEQTDLIFDTKKYKARWIPHIIPTLIFTGSVDHITPLNLFKKNEQYQRENIMIKEISGAGHYPWFENAEEVIQVFKSYVEKLEMTFKEHP
jgi:pimeloyl-ACP methyl ester carboxylesterase